MMPTSDGSQPIISTSGSRLVDICTHMYMAIAVVGNQVGLACPYKKSIGLELK